MSQVQRRRLLIGVGALLAAGRALAKQPGRRYRIGALFGGGPESMQRYLSALSDGLATHGFAEGRNLHIDASPTGAGTGIGSEDDLDAVHRLLERQPDALFTCLTIGTQAAQRATRTVPTVFAWVEDPVAAGLVRSYARPGGNITGVSNHFAELLIKRLGLARELVPGITRVAVIGYPIPTYELFVRPLRSVASRMGIELLEGSFEGYWAGSLDRAADRGAGAVLPVTIFDAFGDHLGGEQVIERAREHRLPVIFAGAEMVKAGGLMSYGTNLVDDVRRGGDLLAQVLRGAKPADLPVDQSARFELAVNLSAAKAIGLSVPRPLLLRADRVLT